MKAITIWEAWAGGMVQVDTVHLDDDSAVVTLYTTERSADHPSTALVRLTATEADELIDALIEARKDANLTSGRWRS